MRIHLAENLRFLRGRSGYSLEALAEALEVSRQSVAKWESGESCPDLIHCLQLADLFEVTLDELVKQPLRLRETPEPQYSPENLAMGTVKIDDTGRVQIPESVRNLFGILPGERVLLLADQNRGIALMKCSQLDEEDEHGDGI